MKKFHAIKGAVCAAFVALPILSLADWVPVEGDVSISKSRPHRDKVDNNFNITVTVENNSSEVIQGPFRILIDKPGNNGRTATRIQEFDAAAQALMPSESMSVVVSFPQTHKHLNFNTLLQHDPSDWNLVWSDEFDGDSLNTNKWEHEVNCWGGGNLEQQCYTDRTDNSVVADGVLKIIAQREDFTGPAQVDGSGSATLPYTSARLRTMNKGDWKYGRMEIRAKLPYGQGTHPAIWMLPTNYVYGGWAASGEIDIMEAINLKTASDSPDAQVGDLESSTFGTLHFGEEWPNNVHSGAEYTLPNNMNPADDFHVYAVEWEKDEIRWYVDNVHFATQRSSGWYSQFKGENGVTVNGAEDAPYNQPFHLLINLAVGGTWAGNVNDTGIDETVFPQMLSVDYVRVYECSVSPATGGGCATVSDDAEFVEGHQAPEIVDPNDNFGSGAVFDLYTDGLSDGLFFNSYNPDGAVTFGEEEVEGRGFVLDINKAGPNGNVYIEYPPRVNLGLWQEYGELVFDLYITSSEDATELLVKLDSGWPDVSDYSVSLPESGEWVEVRINIGELLANGNRYAPGSYADITDIVNPFVVEPTGAMDFKLDNVRYEYSFDDVEVVTVFDDTLHSPFNLGQYVASGAVHMDIAPASDLTHGDVLQLSFDTNESVVFFQTKLTAGGDPLKVDLSGFDYLEFDLHLVADPRATQNFMVKMDCGHPCGSGDYEILAPSIGEWTSYKIPLSDLVFNPGSSLDLTSVDSPLVIFPAWGNQQGVVMEVDNVRLSKDET